MTAKRTPHRMENFRLSMKSSKELAAAAKRTGMSKTRIIEELILRYCPNFGIKFVFGDNQSANAKNEK